MEVRQFIDEVIRPVLADKTEGEGIEVVYLRPNMSVALKKAMLPIIRDKFIEGMKQIPNIQQGLSYIMMAGSPGFHLEQRDALVCQAIGKALEVWNLFPSESMKELFAMDSIGQFPMNTGLKEE